MKFGIAKDNYGIRLDGKFKPTNPSDGNQIIKDHEYLVPDNYDFNYPEALFKEQKGKVK